MRKTNIYFDLIVENNKIVNLAALAVTSINEWKLQEETDDKIVFAQYPYTEGVLNSIQQTFDKTKVGKEEMDKVLNKESNSFEEYAFYYYEDNNTRLKNFFLYEGSFSERNNCSDFIDPRQKETLIRGNQEYLKQTLNEWLKMFKITKCYMNDNKFNSYIINNILTDKIIVSDIKEIAARYDVNMEEESEYVFNFCYVNGLGKIVRKELNFKTKPLLKNVFNMENVINVIKFKKEKMF